MDYLLYVVIVVVILLMCLGASPACCVSVGLTLMSPDKETAAPSSCINWSHYPKQFSVLNTEMRVAENVNSVCLIIFISNDEGR